MSAANGDNLHLLVGRPCSFSRAWGMPTGDTFDCPPIGDFVRRWMAGAKVSVDPFARNKRWATHTNDLNPATQAEHHMDAEAFLNMLMTRKRLKAALSRLVRPGGVCLHFGWNTVGMGKGWRIEEILLVCHGSDHNDTICMAERRTTEQMELMPANNGVTGADVGGVP